MVIYVAVPVALCLVGLLTYVLAGNAKLQRIGEIMFFCGLLAIAFLFAGGRLRL